MKINMKRNININVYNRVLNDYYWDEASEGNNEHWMGKLFQPISG